MKEYNVWDTIENGDTVSVITRLIPPDRRSTVCKVRKGVTYWGE